ncbi:peptidase U62 modulator of DNA gyrase [Gemmatirosa kalamazoonensis]|uniref:Peptidase U62 modulator of DNA gyrase n=2 Tax=Gemmatirosa kalamazoonensis TaxID=861299 RepID=W0RDM7_9BACT|nr:peptidase U62 modulator of DNA gyrase [Gemmatirosa kalamazoonensis]
MKALDAARAAGADYADVRVGRYRSQFVATRERRVQGMADSETVGVGVRTLVGGAWGFAATRELTADGVTAAARQAAAQAKANRSALVRPVTLAPVTPTPNGEWASPIKVDPFTVPVADKVALLLAANEAALKAGARFVSSALSFLREEKTFASTDGTFTVQTLFRASPNINVTAVSSDNSDFQSRNSAEIAPRGLGYEYVTDSDLVAAAGRYAAEAQEKLKAKPVDVGRYDLVLHPSNLWLTIHESVAHPTELDRALGYEANYAGTSFVAPPEKVLGTMKYGSSLMNIQADRSQVGSLAACGWDDEGVKPETYTIIRNGVVVDYQTTREQAPYLDWWYKKQGKAVRSHGNSYAQSWSDVQFQRMPNVSLLPGDKEQSYEDLIAATDRGIAIVGDGSFSIDQQRYNGQFSGQAFYEIRGGKIVGMLKDVAYQFRTPEFWGGMDMIGGKASYFLGGANNDGKGQPAQVNAVSHGCVPARFRNVNVINTGRKA